MNHPLPKHYLAFMVNYTTAHKMIGGGITYQYPLFLLIALDSNDAAEFFSNNYEPLYDGVNNKIISVTIKPATADERFYRPSMSFTEKWKAINFK